jgi:hypothetical protein
MRGRTRHECAEWSGHVVKVKGFSGVACVMLGWEIENQLIEFTDDETGDVFEEFEDVRTGRVVVRMVGDDTKHVVDIEDCESIPEDSYCSSCGQIGCGWH